MRITPVYRETGRRRSNLPDGSNESRDSSELDYGTDVSDFAVFPT